MAAHPWNMLVGESAHAYAAFTAYRDMPVDERSIRNLAEQQGRGDTKLFEWSRKFGWPARAKAWDQHVDRARQRATLRVVSASAEKHARMGAALRDRAYRQLFNRLDVGPDGAPVEKVPLNVLVKALEVGVQLHRSGLEVATSGSDEVATEADEAAYQSLMETLTSIADTQEGDDTTSLAERAVRGIVNSSGSNGS